MDPFTIAAIGTTVIGSVGNIIGGISRKNKAQRALDNFRRQELKNVTKDMRVSTMGAELQTRRAQSRFESSVDALRSGGVRGLVGGMGNVAAADQDMQANISVGLDQQQVAIDRMAAQDEANIRAMQEQRESAAIAGLGAEVAAGRNQTSMGIKGIADAGVSALTAGFGPGKAPDVMGTARAGIDAGGASIKASQYLGSTAQGYMQAKTAASNAFGGGTNAFNGVAKYNGYGLTGSYTEDPYNL
jgi:hypothetical protein